MSRAHSRSGESPERPERGTRTSRELVTGAERICIRCQRNISQRKTVVKIVGLLCPAIGLARCLQVAAVSGVDDSLDLRVEPTFATSEPAASGDVVGGTTTLISASGDVAFRC